MTDGKKRGKDLIREIERLRKRVDELQRQLPKGEGAERQLWVSDHKYKTLLENLPQKIFLKDKESVYVSCNENYARDMRIKSDEIAGKTDYDFFPKELAEKYRADDKRIMQSGKIEELEEKYVVVRGFLRDSEEMTVHTVKTPVRDEGDNVIGILGIFWDITEKKRTEKELKRRLRELGAFHKILKGRERKITALERRMRRLEGRLTKGGVWKSARRT